MISEIELKSIINKLERIEDMELLQAIKNLLDFGLKKKEKKSISDFAGIMTEQETNELESIIADGCERVDDEW